MTYTDKRKERASHIAHNSVRHRETGVGRKAAPINRERRANRRAAIGFMAIAVGSFAASLYWNQPVLALAAFVFLATAALVAKGA